MAESNTVSSLNVEDVAKKMSEDEGMQDLRNLTISMGIHAVRESFKTIAKEFGKESDDVAQYIENISPITERGCMQVDFFNKSKEKADKAYLMLDSCPIDHDLGAQLEAIKPHISEEKWPEVLKSLSMLIFLGRSVYSKESRKNMDFIKTLIGESDGAAESTEASTEASTAANFLDYKIDLTNTTLYLDPSWSNRIGIYVRFDE